eukprot:scaffold7282_cov113-Isochrysis_galbana.AAC.14
METSTAESHSASSRASAVAAGAGWRAAAWRGGNSPAASRGGSTASRADRPAGCVQMAARRAVTRASPVEWLPTHGMAAPASSASRLAASCRCKRTSGQTRMACVAGAGIRSARRMHSAASQTPTDCVALTASIMTNLSTPAPHATSASDQTERRACRAAQRRACAASASGGAAAGARLLPTAGRPAATTAALARIDIGSSSSEGGSNAAAASGSCSWASGSGGGRSCVSTQAPASAAEGTAASSSSR